MNALLVLIDFQREFLERRGLQPCAGEVVDQAALLLGCWRRAGQPVMHVRLTVPQGVEAPLRHWRKGGASRCVEGSPGHAAHERLRESGDETVLHKSGYRAPGLSAKVRELGVDAVVVSGLLSHACVRSAVLDLLPLGLRIVVAADATASDDPVHAAATRRYLEDRAVAFAPSSEIADALEEGRLPVGEAQAAVALDGEVDAASGFFPRWSATPFSERASLVDSLAALLSRELEAFARLIAVETGKPIRFARVEVSRTVDMARAAARRLARSRESETFDGGVLRRCPHGVVAVVTPWNNPVYLPLGKILPSILCGNTVVWKPAPEADRVALALVGLLRQCGWPESLVRLLSGGARMGRSLLSHPGIDAATITASDAAGFSASEICGSRRIPLQAELGGNNAAIVWSDADLERAAKLVAAGAFELSGQRCTANRRVVVHRAVLDGFSGLLAAAAESLRAGTPLDPDADLGPMVGAKQRGRVADRLRRVRADGLETTTLAPVSASGSDREAWELHPAWLPPTLVRCDEPRHEIVQEETFGPVLVVQAADTWEEAIALCNGVRQGLAAALFAKSDSLVERFLAEARAGILKINASTADAAVDIPFGGWKASGIGPPEHGDGDLEFHTRLQTVYR